MHFLTSTREQLLGPLHSVSGIVEKRQTMPILSNVLIKKEGERLSMTASDIDIQIRVETACQLAGDNQALTVAARKLLDILRALPNDAEISFDIDNERLTVVCGKSRFNLVTLPADSYPLMSPPDIGQSTRLVTTQRAFRQQLAQVTYAMAVQDIRYYLNGLLLLAGESEMRMVSTDGHRLAYARARLDTESSNAIQVILPRKTVLELSRQISDTDDSLEIILAGNQAVFRFGAVELLTKLIDGKFPDYEKVIPQTHPHVLRLDRGQFHAALSRAAILTNEKLRGIRLTVENNRLCVISHNAEQEEAQEELDVDYQQQPLDIGFNVTYLIDVLNNVNSETIELHLNDNNSSALVMLPDNPDFKYVVMPMRI